MACYVFYTVWVETLLAFPAELFEVNLEKSRAIYSQLSVQYPTNDLL